MRKFLTQKGGEALALLPKDAVDAPSLEAFTARLDGAGQPDGLGGSASGKSCHWMGFKFPSNPNHFVILWKQRLGSFDLTLAIPLNFSRADYSIGSRSLYISWYDSDFRLLHSKLLLFISETLRTPRRSLGN